MQDFTRGCIKVSSKNSIEYIVSSIESRKKEKEKKDSRWYRVKKEKGKIEKRRQRRNTKARKN